MTRLGAFLAMSPIALGVVMACGSDGTTSTGTVVTATDGSDTLPDVFKHFSSAVEVSIDGAYVVLRTSDIPDHKSVYFPTSDTMYQAYNGSNASFSKAPNTITAQQLVFRIPLHPAAASNHAATPLGPIGIAVNGVAIFNQYNGQNRPLTVEINSFDQGNVAPGSRPASTINTLNRCTSPRPRDVTLSADSGSMDSPSTVRSRTATL